MRWDSHCPTFFVSWRYDENILVLLGKRCRNPFQRYINFTASVKIRTWAAVVVFVSGYAPLAWILAILDFDFDNRAFSHPIAAWSVIGVSILSIITLWLTIRELRGEYVVEVTEVEDRSHEFLDYALPYISSFALGEVLGKLNNGLAVLAFLALLGAISLSTQIVLINPLLALRGFGLYGLKIKNGDHSYTRLVISRFPPQEGGNIKVCALSKALLYGEKPFNN